MRKGSFEKYGLTWEAGTIPLEIEMFFVKHGGNKIKDGVKFGEGLEFHMKAGISICWPKWVWHKWSDMFIKEYLTHRTIAVLGPASSGKSSDAAIVGLFDYYCFPHNTTGIYCSTTREMLEQRIWGEVKQLHLQAKDRFKWLPGHMIDSRQRIVTNAKDEDCDGRDFRNGLMGVPAKVGNDSIGLSSFVGIKNARVRLFCDEASLMPRVFVDAISNLDKNTDFKAVALGNPKDTTDALGVMAEPSTSLGGWDSGIDQSPVTKTWETRRPNGIALQFVGSDSPNLDGKLGIPLLTQEQIDRDVAFYGTDSLWYTMMNQGMMPRGNGSRRVLTRQECDKFGAFKPPVWLNSNRTKGASLDAAYKGVGGDRCILAFWEFGEEITPIQEVANNMATALVNQPAPESTKRSIFALTETMIVPIKNDSKELPEDQIVQFVINECQKRFVPPENFFYDSGMRTSLVQSFSRLWSTSTNSIDCGGTASLRKVSHDIDVLCKDYYSKRITEIWFTVRMMVQAGQFRGMTDEVLSEFSSREWTIVGANKTEVEPKEQMKKKAGRSPDLADCCAIGAYGAILKGFIIRKPGQINRFQNNNRWKRDLKEKSDSFWKSGQLADV